MSSFRTILLIAAVSAATLAASACATSSGKHDSHHPAQAAGVQTAQTTPAKSEMGMGAGAAMPDHSEHMKAMREMHDKMMAAKTPEERHALMAEQMKLMHKSMAMMGGMGGMGHDAMTGGKPGDMAARQGMLEHRMDMMQSMMQMMMERMQSVPATK